MTAAFSMIKSRQNCVCGEELIYIHKPNSFDNEFEQISFHHGAMKVDEFSFRLFAETSEQQFAEHVVRTVWRVFSRLSAVHRPKCYEAWKSAANPKEWGA